MPNFEFKKKKEQAEIIRPASFQEADMTQITNFDMQMDENAYLLEENLDSMNAEEVASAREQLSDIYYNQSLANVKKNGGDASEREQRKLRKEANKKVSTTSSRVAKMKNNITKLVYNYAKTQPQQPLTERPILLQGLMGLSTKGLSSKEAKKLKLLKKSAPAVYERFMYFENYYNKLIEAGNADEGVIQIIRMEYENAKKAWMKLQDDIRRDGMVVPVDANLEKEHLSAHNKVAKYLHKNDGYLSLELNGKDIIGEHSQKPSVEVITGNMDSQLEGTKIDWNADLDSLYEKEKEELGEKPKVTYLNDSKVREMRDLRNARFVKEQMKKIIESEPDPKPTMEEIEETVNSYLKEVYKSAEFRFVARPDAVSYILDGCTLCGNCYDEIFDEYYGLTKEELQAPGNFTFGYLGAKDAAGMKMSKRLSNYGSVSMKLYRDKLKDTSGIVVGNSAHLLKQNRARKLDAPDILSAGNELINVYKRAKAFKQGEKLGSVEQEAHFASPSDAYFEWQHVGQITAREIEEVTFIVHDNLQGVKNMDKLKNKLHDKNLVNLYNQVNIINKNAKAYGREGMPPMKMVVWSDDGVTISYEELKGILGNTKNWKE